VTYMRRAALAALPWMTVATAAAQPGSEPPPPWTVGALLDIGYVTAPDAPKNHVFRGRGTTPRLNDVVLDMVGVWISKAPASSSRWGTELTAHAGEDSKTFAFSSTAPDLPASDWLLHFGPTNVSYLAPVGSGLTVQGGIFNSIIGYDALYAKDNFSYTRPWGADYTPYLMLGVNAKYRLSDRLTGTFILVNGYFHLAHANDMPSVGTQLAYQASDRVTVKQSLLIGPHQTTTSPDFWRILSDSIIERRTPKLVAALEYQIGAERLDTLKRPEAIWMSAQALVHWALGPAWSATLRPEFAWDRDGRWITGRVGEGQAINAVTSTLEYRASYWRATTRLRLEHRFDRSHGPGAGFFNRSGGLAPRQHVLLVALVSTVDVSVSR
jgi:Putative beta-barrel porin-2, OmpL-like. bbp2